MNCQEQKAKIVEFSYITTQKKQSAKINEPSEFKNGMFIFLLANYHEPWKN